MAKLRVLLCEDGSKGPRNVLLKTAQKLVGKPGGSRTGAAVSSAQVSTNRANFHLDRPQQFLAVDRLPTGGIEVIDYKTGNTGTQSSVDQSLQLSIYALACRDSLGLGTPERVTLYYTESATRMSTVRTDEELDAVRDDIVERVALIRSGDFAATPSADACRYCDYARMCPSRV